MQTVRYMRDGSTQKIEVGNYAMVSRGRPGKTARDHAGHHHSRNRARKLARASWLQNADYKTDNSKFPI